MDTQRRDAGRHTDKTQVSSHYTTSAVARATRTAGPGERLSLGSAGTLEGSQGMSPGG